MGTVLFILSLAATILNSIYAALEIPDGGVFPTTENTDIYLQLLQRVENLEKRDQQQQAEIDKLRGELNTEKQQTAVLEERLEQLKQTCAEQRKNQLANPILDAARKQADADVGATEQEVIQSRETESVHGDRSTSQPGDILTRIRRHQNMPVVAFHASLSTDALHLGVHQSIAFDNVVTNIGGAYNPHMGSFIAPVAGVYVFHTTLQNEAHQNAWVRIVKNRVPVANIYLRGDEVPYASNSAVVVQHLVKGDDVMVENKDADKGIDGENRSMFSGFLLYQDNADETIVG